jgi:hydrogenase expression/formation protein HypC
VTHVPACDATRCVTCSDEAVAMRVLEPLAGGLAICVDDEGTQVEVMTDLVGRVGPNDHVLVHAGVALVIESPKDFR